MRVRSTARPGETKLIDDHVIGADKQGGVAVRRDWNCNGDRQAGRKQLLWSVEDGARCCSTARVTNRSRASLAPRADSVANWSISTSGDDRMEKLLLTVREAADVLSVSRSRVYELIYAEQLDSVKIGRSRRVSLASVRRLADGPSPS